MAKEGNKIFTSILIKCSAAVAAELELLRIERIERLLLNNTTTIYLSKEENIITY